MRTSLAYQHERKTDESSPLQLVSQCHKIIVYFIRVSSSVFMIDWIKPNIASEAHPFRFIRPTPPEPPDFQTAAS